MTLRLENVMGCSTGKGEMTSVQVVMYYNPNCSKNAYKTRDGYIKSDVRRWMDDLAWMIAAWSRSCGVEWKAPIKVLISGTFKDHRVPDTQNFVDVVADAIQEGLGINDREYSIETIPPSVDGEVEPRISITVTQG